MPRATPTPPPSAPETKSRLLALPARGENARGASARRERWRRYAAEEGRDPAVIDAEAVASFVEDELWGTGPSNVYGHVHAVAGPGTNASVLLAHPRVASAIREALAAPRPPARGSARALSAAEVVDVLMLPPPAPDPTEASRVAAVILVRRLGLGLQEVVELKRADVRRSGTNVAVGDAVLLGDRRLGVMLDALDAYLGRDRTSLFAHPGGALRTRRWFEGVRKVAATYGLTLDARSGGSSFGVDEEDFERLCDLLHAQRCLWLRTQVGLTLLLVGGFRASDVGHLDRSHVRLVHLGVSVTLPWSKNDPAGEGQVRVLPDVAELGHANPTTVLGDWVSLTRHLPEDAPLWPTHQHGLMHADPRRYAYGGAAAALTDLLRDRCHQVGVDATGVSSHSGRHSVRRTLREAGCELPAAAAYLGHQHVATTLRYGAVEQHEVAAAAGELIRSQVVAR